MDILERLEASPLGAAARRLTYERPEPEPPDDMGVPPTVPAAAEDAGASRRAPSAEPDSPDLVEMRRDLDSVTAQLGNLTDLMQAVYEQQQQQLQQNDRQTDRQTERTTDRQTEQMNDSQTRSPSATQKQNAEQYDYNERQYDEAIAAAAAAAAAVGVGVGVGVGAQNGDNSEQGTVSVCMLKCAISALQTVQWHSAHNPAQQCTTDKRWTTNCCNTWDHIQKVRPAVTAAFIEGVSVPGVTTADAVEDFEAEITPWLEADGSPPAQHLKAGLVIEGFKRASAAVAEDAKALVHCCVLRSGDLQVMLSEVEQTGEYDMEASESVERVGQLPGFRDFDPATAGGSENWDLVKQILVCYGSKSVNAALDEQVAKGLWEQLEITSVREFTALERRAYSDWKRAGGSISDSTRIQDIKGRFGSQLLAAYNAYVLSEDTHGRHDPQLEKQWSRFKQVFRRVGQAVERSGGEVGTAAPAQIRRNVFAVVTARGAAGEAVSGAAGNTPDQQRLMQIKNMCFEHSKLGNCSYGEQCRFSHAGEPGALRHMIVNEAGECVQFNRFGNCRRLDRGRCTFVHNPQSVQPAATAQRPAPAQNNTAVMTEEQHRQIVSYAAATGREVGAVTLEEAQTAARTPAAARNVFAVLHQDKAEKVRKMRPKAVAAIQWKKWTKENDDFDDEEEEDYYDQ